MRSIGWSAAAILVLTAGCDAGEVRIQPLPPMDLPTPEARFGLPEVSGDWRLVGWEIASREVLDEAPLPATPGAFRIDRQRLDSIGGHFAGRDAAAPLVGEVRRDGVVSLVAFIAGTGGRFAAGRVLGDTLWIEYTNLPETEEWPRGTRAAFRRIESPLPPWVRIAGQLPMRDTLLLDTARVDTLPVFVNPEGPDTVPAPPVRPQPQAAPQQTAPQQTAPPPAPRRETPAPRPEPTPQPRADPRPDPPAPRPQPADTPRREPPAPEPALPPPPDTTPRPQVEPPGPRTDLPPEFGA
jgi:hypothetical protein